MRSSHLIVAAALTVGLVGCEQQPAGDAVADGDTATVAAGAEESIRQLVDAFVTAWNRADTATFTSAVADDAVLLQPNGPALEGRDAIVNASIGNYDIAAYQQSATVDEVRTLGDHAYARGTWQLDPTAGAETMVGKWSAVYQRGPGGEWQLWRWMWNQPTGQTAGT